MTWEGWNRGNRSVDGRSCSVVRSRREPQRSRRVPQWTRRAAVPGYGPLIPDPAGILAPPVGFSYRIVDSTGILFSGLGLRSLPHRTGRPSSHILMTGAAGVGLSHQPSSGTALGDLSKAYDREVEERRHLRHRPVDDEAGEEAAGGQRLALAVFRRRHATEDMADLRGPTSRVPPLCRSLTVTCSIPSNATAQITPMPIRPWGGSPTSPP